MFSRRIVARGFAALSVLMLVAIGFVATPPPRRVPLFVVNAALTLPVIIFGNKRERVAGGVLLVIVSFLAKEEYSAGEVTHRMPPRVPSPIVTPDRTPAGRAVERALRVLARPAYWFNIQQNTPSVFIPQ